MRTLRSSRRSAPFQSTTTAITSNEYHASSSSDSSDDSSSKSEYANDSSDLNDDALSIGEYTNDSSNLNDEESSIGALRDEAVGDSPRNSNNTIQHDASASSSPQVSNGAALSAVSSVGKAFEVRIKLSSDASDSGDESTSSNVWKTSRFDNDNGDWRNNYGEGAKDFDIHADIKPDRKNIPKSNKPVGLMREIRDERHIIANEVGKRKFCTLENPHFSELLKDLQVEHDSLAISIVGRQRFTHNLLRFLRDVIGAAFVKEDFLTNDLFEIGDDEALTILKKVYTIKYNRETKTEKLQRISKKRMDIAEGKQQGARQRHDKSLVRFMTKTLSSIESQSVCYSKKPFWADTKDDYFSDSPVTVEEMNYGRNKWKFSELQKIPKGTWTTCQFWEIQRLPLYERDQIPFPAGNKDKPCDEAVEKKELFDNPNAIAAWYLFTIETIGVVPKHDSRIKQDEGECLILNRGFETSNKCKLRWGNVSTSHAQLAGAMDSVVKGYMAQVPNRKGIYAIQTEVSKKRSGCHMCLDPR
eukprot:scaffold91946_cov33-Attheya_sp.AAC.1